MTGATTWAERSLIASGWYPHDALRDAEARLRSVRNARQMAELVEHALHGEASTTGALT